MGLEGGLHQERLGMSVKVYGNAFVHPTIHASYLSIIQVLIAIIQKPSHHLRLALRVPVDSPVRQMMLRPSSPIDIPLALRLRSRVRVRDELAFALAFARSARSAVAVAEGPRVRRGAVVDLLRVVADREFGLGLGLGCCGWRGSSVLLLELVADALEVREFLGAVDLLVFRH